MMDDARAEFTAAPDWLYDLQRKAEKRAGRPRYVRADSPHSYRKDFGFSLSCEVKKIFIPTGNMVAKKSGGSREEMIPAGFILRATVTAPDGRQHRKFSIVSRTDPAKVAAMTAEIERICGPAAATQFSTDAADVLATYKPPTPKVSPAREESPAAAEQWETVPNESGEGTHRRIIIAGAVSLKSILAPKVRRIRKDQIAATKAALRAEERQARRFR
jgi:hypothetical protein